MYNLNHLLQDFLYLPHQFSKFWIHILNNEGVQRVVTNPCSTYLSNLILIFFQDEPIVQSTSLFLLAYVVSSPTSVSSLIPLSFQEGLFKVAYSKLSTRV